MWELEKDVVISSSHNLRDYTGPCANVHGHNWKITVYCRGSELDRQGMLIDFKEIKNLVNTFDHKHLNDIPPFDKINPTAERIAEHLCELIPHCYKVLVVEQDGSRCIFERATA